MSRPLNYLISIQLIRAQHEKFKHAYDAHSERGKLHIHIKDVASDVSAWNSAVRTDFTPGLGA
jgi:hypothetical protein